MKTSEGYEVPFALNQEILEEVEVDVPKLVNGKLETAKEKAIKKTVYIDVKPQLAKCDWDKHYFIPKQTPVGNFQCKICKYIKLAEPYLYKYSEGRLLPR